VRAISSKLTLSENMTQHFFAAMGGRCEVVISGVASSQAPGLLQQAEAEVRRIETKYSRYLPASLVSQINQAAGKAPVSCDDETLQLFAYADNLFQVSDGLFDITSGVLRRAWNFQIPALPDATQLHDALALIGWSKVERTNDQIYLPQAGMEIDFGGFGKEYAADRVASLLSHAGVKSGYVNLSGDVRVIGPKPDGSPWIFGIQDPRHADKLFANIPLDIGALATSGDYERYFELDGLRYCHVLNPQSGYPTTFWQSVSVLAPLAVIAGSYTTIAMLKQEAALAFLDQSNLPYLAIDQSGKIHQKSQSDVKK
jgi:thiamine biosynthesis lipoprotein